MDETVNCTREDITRPLEGAEPQGRVGVRGWAGGSRPCGTGFTDKKKWPRIRPGRLRQEIATIRTLITKPAKIKVIFRTMQTNAHACIRN